MIPEVTEETLETIKEQAKRDWGEYACRVMVELEEKQPELVLWLKLTCEQHMDMITDNIIENETYGPVSYTHLTLPTSDLV